MRRALLAVLVLLVAAGGAFYWFILRDDAPEEFSLPDPTGSTASPDGASIEGTWTVQTDEDTAARFRIKESFLNGLTDHTAAGTSPEVEGSMVISGTRVSDASFTVDLTALEFTDDLPGLDLANRSRALEDDGLETRQFPEATFALTEPIELDEVPAVGETVTRSATGELTLHGETKAVTFDVDARYDGTQIQIVSTDTIPVVLADYGMTAPVRGPVASVDDKGSFEFTLVLRQS